MKIHLALIITAPAPVADSRDAAVIATLASLSLVAATAALFWSLA
ncbi:MAG: hypothetical protein JWM58_568 [Rhizobium sp.]|nr:hypothetical protein [Rhizobium sp.]